MAVFRTIPAGDLKLVSGDVVVLGLTDATRVQYIRQKIASLFKFFLGEWFLDKREGIPYYRDVFVKNPNLPLIRSLFLRVLKSTPGVISVATFKMTYDPAARELSSEFEAVVDGGELSVSAGDADFVVGLAPVA